MKFEENLNCITKDVYGKPVYNGKYLKAKIKSYYEKFNTSFHNNKIPKEGSQCACLSVTFIDSTFRKVKHVILKSLSNNVNMMLKKTGYQKILLMI